MVSVHLADGAIHSSLYALIYSQADVMYCLLHLVTVSANIYVHLCYDYALIVHEVRVKEHQT